MKIIFVLRHAKSSWDEPNLKDYDRPLNSRGKNATRYVAQTIASFSEYPEIIISSSAKRALQTSKLVSKHLKNDWEILLPVEVNENIYEASVEDIVRLIKDLPDKWDRIALVGHNPCMEELVDILTFGEDINSVRMPTAGLACIIFDNSSNWSQIGPGTGYLDALIYPKLIKNMIEIDKQ